MLGEVDRVRRECVSSLDLAGLFGFAGPWILLWAAGGGLLAELFSADAVVTRGSESGDKGDVQIEHLEGRYSTWGRELHSYVGDLSFIHCPVCA
jgi:hypothetical protein